jgi:hypothetical protein
MTIEKFLIDIYTFTNFIICKLIRKFPKFENINKTT